ncbi:MAG: ABC transporter ATP-binding protein [Clostridia bacterium]|nr:ABC transporter ATP-binding protein [Clostridia bacterium]
MNLLEVKNLTVRYERQCAVENVSFSLQEGDYAAIVGENGSGKSTLVKTLVGLIPAADGEITMHGLTRGEIGYLPQSTVVQKDFPASVTEVVLTGCLAGGTFRPFYSKAQKELAKEMMELLGVTPFAKKSFRELSGGQQQRVLLARALCATKKLLILDEPASVLDPVVTHELYAILRKLNRERGITILMVSHDIHCALEQAKTILHMDRTLRFSGTVEDYADTPEYRRMIGDCITTEDLPHVHHHHHHHNHAACTAHSADHKEEGDAV